MKRRNAAVCGLDTAMAIPAPTETTLARPAVIRLRVISPLVDGCVTARRVVPVIVLVAAAAQSGDDQPGGLRRKMPNRLARGTDLLVGGLSQADTEQHPIDTRK